MIDQEKYWDAAATDPDVRYKYIADEWAKTKMFIHLIEKYQPDFTRTCEIGCGIGRLLHEIAIKYPESKFYGTDISAGMIAKAKRAKNITYMHGTTLPDKLTTIYSMLVFQHITHEQKRDYINRAYYSLTIGGKMIVQFVVGDENTPYSYQTTIRAMFDMMADAGFRDIETEFPVIHDQWCVLVGVK
jgi:trans-aconitate methyltransferase